MVEEITTSPVDGKSSVGKEQYSLIDWNFKKVPELCQNINPNSQTNTVSFNTHIQMTYSIPPHKQCIAYPHTNGV